MALIRLSRSNFFYNLAKIEECTQSLSKIALVLKDNAYGHGICEIASLAREYGITKVIVRSEAEAFRIESYFEYILVLADIPSTPSKKIRYTINDIKNISKYPKGTLVELKVNTSMNRNGIDVEEFEETLLAIKSQGLTLGAIFTHHSCADELNGNYERQKKNFEEIKKIAPTGVAFHSANSAALFREKEFCEDMARVGIAAYGCMELPKSLSHINLKPVLQLFAQKISSRKLDVGDSVGYGASFVASNKCRVSNYNFGYGDGFLRSCSIN